MRHDNPKILQLLNILEDPKSTSARKSYLQLFDLNEIDDQAVYHQTDQGILRTETGPHPLRPGKYLRRFKSWARSHLCRTRLTRE